MQNWMPSVERISFAKSRALQNECGRKVPIGLYQTHGRMKLGFVASSVEGRKKLGTR